MAKKEKVQLTPEELAAKKLKTKKNWARVGAVVLALAITGGVYGIGSKGGHKTVEVAAPTAATQAQTTKKAETTTKAAEPTTAAAATTKAAETTTKASSSSSSSSSILDTITGALGGLGDMIGGGSGSLPSIDGDSAASTVEKVGGTLQDFFYGMADKVETTTAAAAQ